jgi:SAM-dependent methyltransferase
MKKYALNNSYFKVNKMCELPDTITDIDRYLKEHGELPFRYTGTNWVYDAFTERQKYRGVQNSQFLTPDATAERMAHFSGKYFLGGDVLEPCCGTGQITKQFLKDGYRITAFDNDFDMVYICGAYCENNDNLRIFHDDFLDKVKHNRDDSLIGIQQIIANPPYEISALTGFLEWIDKVQSAGGISILLLPKGFVNKDRPKRTFQALRKFGVIDLEDMRESFARTHTKAEIAVLKKL